MRAGRLSRVSDRHVAQVNAAHFTQSEHKGRASVPMSDGWRKYRRFNAGDPVWITDADGNPRWLTQTQASIASLLVSLPDGTVMTWKRLSELLHVSASTVSRTAWKLMSYGLVAFVTGRGRYGGSIILKRKIGDGLDRFRKLAKAKVRQWALATARRWNERVSRSGFNRATYETWRKGSSTTITNTVGCTIEWTVQDLRDVGII